MQLFINETSLHSQYSNQNDFINSLKLFISSIKRISEIKNEKFIHKSDHFFYYSGLEGNFFESILKKNPPLNQTFVQNLKLVNPKSWQNDQKHDNTSSYEFNNENFVTTSVAEITERKLIVEDFYGFLINFNESKFGSQPKVGVLKNSKDLIEVDSIVTPEDIEDWLISKGFINPEESYDENSRVPPADYQTVLKDTAIFEKTNYPRNNGRKVYKRKGTNELWVVDNAVKHAGSKAHIEVFDERTKMHIGTSIYNLINIEDRYKVKNRSINLG
jgi:hypothetical protein